jgi:nitroreductase
MTDKEKVVFETIFARRSIRQFVDGKPVEREKIVKLLEMAMAAPSACNIQPWEFIVISEQETINKIKGMIFQGNYNTPLIFVVCGNPKFILWENDIGKTDCAAAIENMLLAATAMDLGSVWIGSFNPDDVKKLLSIPKNVHPVGIVYFGYPAENPGPRTQYTEQAVFWEKYDPDREQVKRAGCFV